MVPVNQVEHNDMVATLVAIGIQKSEAEIVIASRKTAFNKALREYKKEAGAKGSQSRKSQRTSKHVESQHSQNGV